LAGFPRRPLWSGGSAMGPHCAESWRRGGGRNSGSRPAGSRVNRVLRPPCSRENEARAAVRPVGNRSLSA